MMLSMNIASATNMVRWTVIGFEVRVYQACQGAPVQPAGTCDRCGQGIKYVVRIKSSAGEVIEVGTDCAVTLEGGPELAEIRQAEREYERAQYLAAPAYARECAEREARKDRLARVSKENNAAFAITIAGLKRIVGSDRASAWERDYGAGKLHGFEAGTRDYDLTDKERMIAWKALCNVLAPDSRFVGTVGARDKAGWLATLESIIIVGVDSAYGPKRLHKFRTDDGSVLVWFASYCGASFDDIGKAFRVVATVKDHSEYNGVKQTILSRCKLSAV